MDLANLKVKIGANTNDLSSGINRASNEVQKFGNNVNKVAAKGKTDFTNLSRVIQDLPFGIMAIQNNLTQLIPGVGAAGLAFTGLMSAVTFAQVGLTYWAKGTGGAKKEANELKETLDKLTESIAKESVQLQTNLVAIRDTNIPLGQRKKAIEDLRNSYGPYLKHLSDEDLLTGKVGDALDRINTALKAKLMLQMLQEKITPIMKEQLEMQLKNEELAKQFAFADKESFKEQYKNRKDLRDADRMFLVQSQIAANKSRAEYDKNNAAIAETEKRIQSLLSTAQPLLEQSFGLDFKENTGSKSPAPVVAELRKELDKLHAQFKGGFINSSDLTDGIVSAYKKAIGDLAAIKAPISLIDSISFEASPEQVKQAMRSFKEFVNKITKDEPIQAPIEIKPVVTMTDAQASLANKGIGILRERIIQSLKEYGINSVTDANGVKIKISPYISTDLLEETEEKAKMKFEDLKVQLGQIVGEMQSSILVGIGDAIGAAISGGDLKGVFSGVLKMVSDGLRQMGLAMIKYGLGIEAMKNAIKNPYLSIAAGVGLVAFSSALQAQIPKFAKGGMVNGPTLAMVGDNPSGKEAIIPFERMGEFISGLNQRGPQEVIVKGEISGDVIRLVYKRSEAKYQRGY